MSVEKNKAIVRRVIAAADQLTLEGMDECLSPEILAQWKNGMAWSRKTFPGHRISITEMVAEGDKVWARVATSGGYAGGWLDIPASDVQWTNTGVAFYRLAEGKVVEYSAMFDVLGHLRQLGGKVVPDEGKAE